MSWTELIALLLMDVWRTVTGRNDPTRFDPGPFFDDDKEENPPGPRGGIRREREGEAE